MSLGVSLHFFLHFIYFLGLGLLDLLNWVDVFRRVITKVDELGGQKDILRMEICCLVKPINRLSIYCCIDLFWVDPILQLIHLSLNLLQPSLILFDVFLIEHRSNCFLLELQLQIRKLSLKLHIFSPYFSCFDCLSPRRAVFKEFQ
jgi:hypothetical protein